MALLFRDLNKSSLIDVDMMHNSFGIEGLRCMVPLLQNSPRLTNINFGRINNFDTDCFELLVSALNGTSVEWLSLRNCCIEDISALDTYNLPNLSHLYLTGNNIGREACIILSNLLQQEGSALTELYLENNGIDDEGAEILASSLKHNTKLHTLHLDENNITKKGCQAFLKILIDVSIESMYNSNHTLTDFNSDKYDGSGYILSALQINRSNRNPTTAARGKIIKYLLNSQYRMKLCESHGVEYSAENNMLADIEPKMLPDILALIGEDHGQSEFYTSLLPVAPDLMSYINREALLRDEKDRNAVQRAQIVVQMKELTRQLADLAAEDDQIDKRLALIKLGDSKETAVVDGGGEKRQRMS